MIDYPFAPVQWQLGQTLLPEHLNAQEKAFSADAYLRQHVGGLPSYGIARLEWDRDLLSSGNFSIKALRLFSQTKERVVDYPGNAYLFNHSVQFEPVSRVEVYIAVLLEKAEFDEPPERCIQQAVKPRLYKILLSTQGFRENDNDTSHRSCTEIYRGKLAEFVVSHDGSWKLSERYIPPLLQLGTSDYLLEKLKQLNILLSRNLKASMELYQQPLPQSRQSDIKQCISALYECRQFIANHISRGQQHGELHLHPYFLYEQLQRLHRHLAMHNGDLQPLPTDIYRHNDLHGTFNMVFENVKSLLTLNAGQQKSFQLHLKDGCYQTTLPIPTNQQDKLYFVINAEHDTPLSNHDLPCISSRKRVTTLYQYSLSSVPLKSVKHKTLNHYFGQHTQCYLLDSSDELNHILQEGSLAFLAQPEYANYTFYVFLQSPHQHLPEHNHGTAE